MPWIGVNDGASAVLRVHVAYPALHEAVLNHRAFVEGLIPLFSSVAEWQGAAR